MENNKNLMEKISSKGSIVTKIISVEGTLGKVNVKGDAYKFFEVTYGYSNKRKEEATIFLRNYLVSYLLDAPKDMKREDKEKMLGHLNYYGFSKDELRAVENFLNNDFTKEDAKILKFDDQLESYKNIFDSAYNKRIEDLLSKKYEARKEQTKVGQELAENIINPKFFDGFEVINKEGERGDDAKSVFIRLGRFLCSDECRNYSSTALGVALKEIFTKYQYKDHLGSYDGYRKRALAIIDDATFGLGVMLGEVEGISGLNNLARMFDRADFDFLKNNIYTDGSVNYVFCINNIGHENTNKIGYVTSKLSKEKQKVILDLIGNKACGSRIIGKYNEIKKMSNKEIKETFEPKKREDKQSSEKQTKSVFGSIGSKIKSVFSKGNNSNKSNKGGKDGQKKQK